VAVIMRLEVSSSFVFVSVLAVVEFLICSAERDVGNLACSFVECVVDCYILGEHYVCRFLCEFLCVYDARFAMPIDHDLCGLFCVFLSRPFLYARVFQRYAVTSKSVFKDFLS